MAAHSVGRKKRVTSALLGRTTTGVRSRISAGRRATAGSRSRVSTGRPIRLRATKVGRSLTRPVKRRR